MRTIYLLFLVFTAFSAAAQTELKSLGSYVWDAGDEPRIFKGKLQLSFVNSPTGFPSFGTVIAGSGYTSDQDGGAFQLYIPYSESYGGNAPQIRMGKYNNQGWTDWATFFTSANANSATADWKAKSLIVYDKVGIGTLDPKAKLAVNGNILAKEIKVKTDITVPDYVFEADYKLPSLAEVETYVKEHKHLPEIPSAKEVSEEGLDLAKMNLLLLKKVEEVTLLLIEKDQEIKKLTNEQAKLQQRVTLLEQP